ncbi:hypothetical protein N182_27675 [Sinorhizobium sp. GL2]|nr:hypothetical protein N182_27675 [Sinorhizobium sp. GL2]
MAIRGDCDNAWHAIGGSDRGIEDCIGSSLEIAGQRNLPHSQGFDTRGGRATLHVEPPRKS